MLKICITYKYFENIKQAYFYWNNNIEEEKEGGRASKFCEKLRKYGSSFLEANICHHLGATMIMGSLLLLPTTIWFFYKTESILIKRCAVRCQMIEILNLAILKYLWYVGLCLYHFRFNLRLKYVRILLFNTWYNGTSIIYFLVKAYMLHLYKFILP